MIGYSKSRIAELMKKKGYGNHTPLNNGYDFVRIEIDELDAAVIDKLQQIVKGNESHEVDK